MHACCSLFFLLFFSYMSFRVEIYRTLRCNPLSQQSSSSTRLLGILYALHTLCSLLPCVFPPPSPPQKMLLAGIYEPSPETLEMCEQLGMEKQE
ncbi:unnamed protein product, partial [Discosporangium mesarthrocarpum]